VVKLFNFANESMKTSEKVDRAAFEGELIEFKTIFAKENSEIISDFINEKGDFSS
jgi:hypothetical protein